MILIYELRPLGFYALCIIYMLFITYCKALRLSKLQEKRTVTLFGVATQGLGKRGF